MLSPAQLAYLEVSTEQELFDGDARLFRLGVDAQRLGLAFEYDPFFSLSIARVDRLRIRRPPRSASSRAAASGWSRSGQD